MDRPVYLIRRAHGRARAPRRVGRAGVARGRHDAHRRLPPAEQRPSPARRGGAALRRIAPARPVPWSATVTCARCTPPTTATPTRTAAWSCSSSRPAEPGYFALEVNGGGAFSLRYIEDPTRTAEPVRQVDACGPGAGGRRSACRTRCRTSWSPNGRSPSTGGSRCRGRSRSWSRIAAPFGPVAGQRWRGNAFKCGDETSHPHWASWAPIGEALNFHQPRCFGALEFELSSQD